MRALVERSEALQRVPADPAQRLLIVGDSTGVGTGATSPQTSLAGLLAQAWPRLESENRAENGAKLADVGDQLEAATGRCDLVLVQAGGNDVMRLRSERALRRDIERAAELARAQRACADHAGRQCRQRAAVLCPGVLVHDRALAHAARPGARSRDAHPAVYINRFQERDQDPFARQPDLMYSADGLQPSDAGYSNWFDVLRVQAPWDSLLAPSRAP